MSPISFATRGGMLVPSSQQALGIGDIVPGASFYAGNRVYNASKIGSIWGAARRTSDLTITNDILFGANGFPDLSNVDGLGNNLAVWRDLNGAATLECRFLREQITNTASNAAAVPLNIVNLATGVLTFGSDTNTEVLDWTSIAGVQTGTPPFSIIGTTKHLGGGANSTILGSITGSPTWLMVNIQTGPNQAQLYQSAIATPVTATCSDNAWHGIVGVANGASSLLNVDGTQTFADTAASNGITADGVTMMGHGAGFNPFKGRCFEAALYSGAMSTPNQNLITTNITNLIASAALP